MWPSHWFLLLRQKPLCKQKHSNGSAYPSSNLQGLWPNPCSAPAHINVVSSARDNTNDLRCRTCAIQLHIMESRLSECWGVRAINCPTLLLSSSLSFLLDGLYSVALKLQMQASSAWIYLQRRRCQVHFIGKCIIWYPHMSLNKGVVLISICADCKLWSMIQWKNENPLCSLHHLSSCLLDSCFWLQIELTILTALQIKHCPHQASLLYCLSEASIIFCLLFMPFR